MLTRPARGQFALLRGPALWLAACILAFLIGRASIAGKDTAQRSATSAKPPRVDEQRGESALQRFRNPDRVGKNVAPELDQMASDAAELDGLRKRGEYILEMEDPGFREAHRSTVAAFSARILKKRDQAGFRTRLEKMGLNSEQIDQAERHLGKIAVAAIDANQHLIQLMDAQVAFDERMRNQLPEGRYEEFREYETELAAGEEMAQFNKFLKKRDLNNSAEIVTAFAELVRLTGATTVENMGGPYDPAPSPAIGVPNVRAQLQRRLSATQRSVEAAQGAVQAKGYPEAIQQEIMGYYLQREAAAKADLHQIENWDAQAGVVKESLGRNSPPRP